MQPIDAGTTSRAMNAGRVKDPVAGYSHLAGLAVALVAVPCLLLYGHAEVGRFVTGLAYGLSLIALYAASSAYHLVIANERVTRRLRLLDHIAIFMLIAGTCTPFFHLAFEGTTRVVMMSVIWALAAAGSCLEIMWRRAPRLLYTSIYVAMGWLVVVRWSTVVHRLPPLALALMFAGGVTYTLGAIVYASKRPNPFPRVFGFHEIWHLFVLAGSGLHFAAVVLLARA